MSKYSAKRNNSLNVVYNTSDIVNHWRDLPHLSDFVKYSNEVTTRLRANYDDRPVIHLVPPKELNSYLSVPVKGYRDKNHGSVFELIGIETPTDVRELIKSKCPNGTIEHHGYITYYIRLPKNGHARFVCKHDGREVPIKDWVIRSAVFSHDGVLKIAVTYSFPTAYNAHRHVSEYKELTIIFNEPNTDYHGIAMGIVYSHRAHPPLVKYALAELASTDLGTMHEFSRALNQRELEEEIMRLTDLSIAKKL